MLKTFSPSHAHDEAWQRTPEHDAMQSKFYQIAMSGGLDGCVDSNLKNFFIIDNESQKELEGGECFKWAWCEFRHNIDGGKPFFSDILYLIQYNKLASNTEKIFKYFLSFEIKPKIYSCGAVIRQIRQQEAMLSVWASKIGNGYNVKVEAEVIPIFKDGDEKIETFNLMGISFGIMRENNEVVFFHKNNRSQILGRYIEERK